MALTQSEHRPSPGAAFHLATTAPLSATLKIERYEVEIAEGSLMVVVRSADPLPEADIVPSCLRYALRALDHLATRGAADLTITRAAENRLTWMPGPAGLILTINDTLPIGIVATATLTVHDAHGKVVPSAPPPPTAWHESMRYFRYSQLAEDVLDALRNLWLATENILDSQCPQQRNEREGDWLRRALAHAGQS